MQAENPPSAISEQELRRRRRDKILARASLGEESECVEPDDIAAVTHSPRRNKNISGLQYIEAKRQYQHLKWRLNWLGFVLGIVAGLSHLLALQAGVVAAVLLSAMVALVVHSEARYSSQSQLFTSQNGTGLGSQIEKLAIISNLLHYQKAVSPVAKFLAAYLLTVVLASRIGGRN